MAISIGGISSGLDVESIVSQLTDSEISPLQSKLYQKQGENQNKISAIGKLTSALSNLESKSRDLSKVSGINASLITNPGEDYFDIKDTGAIVNGTFGVEVNRLATAHKIGTQSIADQTASIGTGKITIQVGKYAGGDFEQKESTETIEIEITEDVSSLTQLRDEINKEAKDLATATIINDGSGYRLVLSSKNTGDESALRISVSDDDGDDSDNLGLSQFSFNETDKNIVELVQPLSSEVVIDNITINNQSNTFDDVIEGLEFTLKEPTDKEYTVVSVHDSSKITDTIKGFVGAFNGVMSAIKENTKYDQDTGEKGALLGDADIRYVGSQLKQMVLTPIDSLPAGQNSLYSIGIKSNATGGLEIDNEVFDEVMSENPDRISKIFAGILSSSSGDLSIYNDDAEGLPAGSHEVNITQTSVPGYFSGSSSTSLQTASLTDKFTIASDTKISLKVSSIEADDIDIPSGVYSKEDFLEVLKTSINSSYAMSSTGTIINPTITSNILTLTMGNDSFRANDSVDITSVSGTLLDYGLSVGAGTMPVSVSGTIGGVEALGNGTLLTGQDDFEDLQVEVESGAVGSRGTVDISKGYGVSLLEVIKGITDSNGILDTKKKSLEDKNDKLIEENDALKAKKQKIEDRYRKQFNALEVQMSKLNTLSSSLMASLANMQTSY